MERDIKDGGYFARKPHNRQAVCAVWRNPEVQNSVGKLQVLRQGHAHGRINRQHHNAAVIVSETKLRLGADHAFRDFAPDF